MKRILFTLAVVVVCLSSCTSYQYTARQTKVVRENIVATPTIVDVRVDYSKRVEERSSRCRNKQEAMDEARYLAITKNNIDVVVDPIYKVEYRSHRYQVTLTGFAGYYTNSRSFYEDVKQLHEVEREDIEKYLILHNPEVLQYFNQGGEVINVYHNDGEAK